MKKQRKPELVARIRSMLEAKMSQADIAKKLDLAPSTVAFHVKTNLGVKPAKYRKAEPVRGGKRKCVKCGERKTPGAFGNKYDAECTMCIRAKSS